MSHFLKQFTYFISLCVVCCAALPKVLASPGAATTETNRRVSTRVLSPTCIETFAAAILQVVVVHQEKTFLTKTEQFLQKLRAGVDSAALVLDHPDYHRPSETIKGAATHVARSVGGEFDENLKIGKRSTAVLGGDCPDCLARAVSHVARNTIGTFEDVVSIRESTESWIAVPLFVISDLSYFSIAEAAPMSITELHNIFKATPKRQVEMLQHVYRTIYLAEHPDSGEGHASQQANAWVKSFEKAEVQPLIDKFLRNQLADPIRDEIKELKDETSDFTISARTEITAEEKFNPQAKTQRIVIIEAQKKNSPATSTRVATVVLIDSKDLLKHFRE